MMMSYPSIIGIMERMGASLETSPPGLLKEALWEAMETDLPVGIKYLKEVAGGCLASGKRLLKVEDPNSLLGRQLARLLGPDIARKICAEKLSVAFGFYNCCDVVVAPSTDMLDLTFREQIQLQNGDIASADC